MGLPSPISYDEMQRYDGPRLEPDEDPDICTLCGHWVEEHTPDCEACALNDETLAPHTFNQAL